MSRLPQILHQSPGLRVVYQPADSDVLVFSFNGGDFNKSEFEFYGSSHFAKRGYAAVGFVDLGSTWFPPGDMNRAIHAVNTHVRRRPSTRAITYGISMGAWGALKYARRLRAQSTLAFGPQWSIDPTLIGHFDRRYARFVRPELHAGMQIRPEDLAEKSFIFFDPRASEDAEHARLLGQMPNIHRILGPFLGHPTIQFWTEMRLIDALFMLAGQTGTEGRDFRWLIRSKRAESSRYFLGRAAHLHWQTGGRYIDLAIKSYREAVRLNRLPADHRDALNSEIGLANGLLDIRQTDEAMGFIDSLCARALNRPYSPELRELLLRVHAYGKARELAYKALEKQPKNAELRIDLARMFMADFDTVSAKAEIDLARQYAGRRPLLWQRISALYSRMGCHDEAAAAERTLASMPAKRSATNADSTRTLGAPRPPARDGSQPRNAPPSARVVRSQEPDAPAASAGAEGPHGT